MKYIKLIPLALSFAMLSTLIYMTFVPSYYLSATLQNSAFSAKSAADPLYVTLSDNIFQREIDKLPVNQLDFILQSIVTGTEITPLKQLNLTEKRNVVAAKLQQHLSITQNVDTLTFNLQVEKSNQFKQLLRSSILNNAALKKITAAAPSPPTVTWQTNYLRVILVFILSFLASYVLASLLLLNKEYSEREA